MIECLERKVRTKDEVFSKLMAEHIALKKSLGGTLIGIWVLHDGWDLVVEFVRRWSEKAEISVDGLSIGWA